MSRISFETTNGASVVVHRRPIGAVHDGQSRVEVATAAGGKRVLKNISKRRAAA